VRAPQESPEQAAARVFELAQNLEKAHKTKEAFAAYRQIVRHYPATAGGQKAAQRIDQEQQAARKRRAQ
jgi:TolA-binding protein